MDTQQMPAHPGGVRIQAVGVGQTVHGGRQTITDVSFAVEPGEVVAIIGGSGVGKTTLLDALAGVRPPADGRVLLDGDVRSGVLDRVGYLPQDDIIHVQLPLARTLGYAARLRLPAGTSARDATRRAAEVLGSLGLAERAGQRVSLLSGGERKRASIAVELLTRPRVLFLDEPTSGLDPATAAGLMRLLRRLADGGATVVLSTHNPADVELCDQTVVLAPDGHLAFAGSPTQALAHFGVEHVWQIYERLSPETAGSPRGNGHATVVPAAPDVAEAAPPARTAPAVAAPGITSPDGHGAATTAGSGPASATRDAPAPAGSAAAHTRDATAGTPDGTIGHRAPSTQTALATGAPTARSASAQTAEAAASASHAPPAAGTTPATGTAGTGPITGTTTRAAGSAARGTGQTTDAGSATHPAGSPTRSGASAQPAARGIGPVRQWWVLSARTFDIMRRNRLTLAILLGSPVLVLAMFVMLFRADAFSFTAPDPATTAMILFWIAFGGFFFGVTYGLLQICTEMAILRRERLSGLRIGPYVLAKVTVLLPLLGAVDAALLGVLRVLRRLPALPAADLGALYLTLVLTSASALGLGLLCSAAVGDAAQASLMLPVVCFPQVLFVGAILPVPVMAAVGRWFSYGMSNRWAFEALGHSAGLESLWRYGGSPLGPPLLASYGDSFARPVWQDWTILAGFTAAFFLATIVVLARRCARPSLAGLRP